MAVGQTLTATARPLTVLHAKDGQPNWAELLRHIDDWQPGQLIVGLPLNIDGKESEFCRRARKFARRLASRSACKVLMFDERLSTREAKRAASSSRANRNYRESPVDALAACLILQSWLQQPEFAVSP
ncbi:MAG: Holliday junction resolvase RuvX [Porticoccaceae bacterium]|nr:Holliday junction resolvase RuvX [Porticoccaceae bacterium]